MVTEGTAAESVSVSAPGGAENPHDARVAAFGYKQELKRTLRFFSLFALSFSIVSISTGIFLNYGFAINQFGGAAIWTWPIAAVGQIVMALLIAELSTKIPLAGYAYQWGARLVGSTYGWYTGFFGLLYMSITGGAIILLGATPLLFNALGIDAPDGLILGVAIAILLFTVAINIISVQLAARVNNVAVVAEIIGTVLLAITVIVAFGLYTGDGGGTTANLWNTSGTAGPGVGHFVMAGLLGIYTMVGFELSADLTEEAVDSQKAVPRAVLTGVIGSAVLGMVALICFTVAMPDLGAAQASDAPIVTIAEYYLPAAVVKTFVVVVAFSMIALVIANQAAQSRLMYSMGRDNMLPFSRHFRAVNGRTRTPVRALIVGGVISVCFMTYGFLQTDSFTTLVGATSIAPYVVYLLIVGSYMRRRPTLAAAPGAFKLGRFGVPLMIVGLLWIVSALLILTIPSDFHGAVKVVAGATVLAILWHLLVLRGRIKRREAGVALLAATPQR
ncbi:amino acid permease [Mycolicibacterium sp.]|uniref:amino acid permease n=1 Tax=Mycolicibacterium sp. TaxID=2320850 RepID=UPI003D109CF9